jgi:hypothetical protein
VHAWSRTSDLSAFRKPMVIKILECAPRTQTRSRRQERMPSPRCAGRPFRIAMRHFIDERACCICQRVHSGSWRGVEN